jgi:D-psicose/D-tagatose/L-ribulose 3-epimerase
VQRRTGFDPASARATAVLWGSGAVDFAKTFAALDRIGYDGTITFESFSSAVVSPAFKLCIWRATWDDGMELAVSTRRFVERSPAATAAT